MQSHFQIKPNHCVGGLTIIQIIDQLVKWCHYETVQWSFLELKIGRPQKHTHTHMYVRTKSHMEAGTLPKNQYFVMKQIDTRADELRFMII